MAECAVKDQPNKNPSNIGLQELKSAG